MRFVLVMFIAVGVTFPVEAENWPGWRGPRGDGIASESSLPVKWGPDEGITWKAAIPGTGHSSPIVWGNRIFLTSCDEDSKERLLLCLDRLNGNLVWKQTVVKTELEDKHRLNSYASSTPATDGKNVFVSFLANGRMVVACFDFEGRKQWQKIPGTFNSRHGFCSPPILYRDMVILNGDQDAKAWIVALDKETGMKRWRANRPNMVRSYCPPLIVKTAGRMQMVLTGSECVASYDPDTGRQLWIVDGPTEQFVASMVHLDGLVFLTAGYPEYHIMAIRPDGTGNVTSSHIQWHHKGRARYLSYVPSPVAYDKYFFLVSDQGYASCYQAKSGELVWRSKLGRHHSASPICINGLLYFPDDDGNTFVVRAGPEFELVAKNSLGQTEVYASPAVSDGQLFIRTDDHLVCIGKYVPSSPMENGKISITIP